MTIHLKKYIRILENMDILQLLLFLKLIADDEA